MQGHIVLLTLCIASVVSSGLGCPSLCVCSDKHGRHFADCANRDLTEVPKQLPPNVTSVSLAANKILLIPFGSFDHTTQVTSLWMTHNEIICVERGSLAPLVRLRNLDISYNKVVHFPWEDLENLTSLEVLKMNHNEMTHVSKDAFANLKDLRSLRLNNNKFVTIAEGTFDALVSLSHIQIYNNPYACTCSLIWLRDWILSNTVTLPEKELITCATPENLKGKVIEELPQSKCTRPKVTIRTEPDFQNTSFYEDGALVLTCEYDGNPKPLVMWRIHSERLKQELALTFTEDSAEAGEDPILLHPPVTVFSNGTVVISKLRAEDGGNYSCSATNEFGRAGDWVLVKVATPPRSTPAERPTHPLTRQATSTMSALDSDAETEVKATVPPSQEANSRSRGPSRLSKCGVTANTRYISSPVLNGSVDDVKHYTFDFGVVALGVSETEATVRLNPLLMPRDRAAGRAGAGASSGAADAQQGVDSDGLYLCVAADRRHAAVQWSRIRDGVNTYSFRGLRPGTNYSLCLTYRGEDCEVQVLFTTRRKVPNLLIIISVSICLLTVSTVPLLGATCFHLVYKYRSKTYKLILKAKDQYQAERHLAVNFSLHAPQAASQRRIGQLDEEEGEEEEEETESGDEEHEADTEESVVAESQCRSNLDECEAGSEYSDRLPLGAEAVNITGSQ
ncbi:immunoglobulin superfamily containing leucine-rich repeat protein 2-like [Betta splendens]|uniref:immunoglobulin superfamily containing leucine-rich repeat protein 2-like n=1 Tax=Betta splendens TaxID=158456 RepID=UPI0010F645E0|nr:immunoglobulin superfamily containing leucine-rich repeat protein 2-like [Betta splendens]